MDPAERMALTALCAELPALREECRYQPESARRLLARVEEEARARRPVLALLDQLLDGGGDEATRQLSGGLPGMGAGQADEESFGCPDDACDRTSVPVPAGPVPRCLVLGAAMKRR
ncbi:hypothetical protein [Saccharothrix luteola]|uniref:hypothetical protein n=1 Tax=Saccharothrix luteola TaxID=2893018 RepID=UPI001E5E2519|nr:hypothetical protein [Saccharothrix luteola]MCC8247635.1 hypothetical protein [Saccharothrix luteola]